MKSLTVNGYAFETGDDDDDDDDDMIALQAAESSVLIDVFSNRTK